MRKRLLSILLAMSMLLVWVPVQAGAVTDITAPEITGIELGATNVEAPGKVEVILSGTDDISGIDDGAICFEDPETEKRIIASLESAYWDSTTHEWTPYADGKLHGEIEVGQYKPSGVYQLASVSLWDKAGNYTDLYGNKIPEPMRSLSISVTNTGETAEVVSTTTDAGLADAIKGSSSDAAIVVDYTNNGTMKQELFDAIAGTDRTLSMESDGVQWVFNGKNVTGETKAIDLDVDVTPLPNYSGSESAGIKENAGDKPTVVLSFADNGVLPGKATVRIKADYSMRQYLGVAGLKVYYYDNTEKKFVLIRDNITLTSDYYIEFDIEHCSDYVITGGTLTFPDVPAGEFFTEPIAWAVEKNITTGYPNGNFGPKDDCNRAQIVTFLWRAYGCPEPESTECPFVDVPKNEYYAKAVMWAVEQGITTGTSRTKFSPNDPCTRGQVATFLWRAAGKPAAGGENPFKDVPAGQFYTEPVLWAVANNITTGTSKTTFEPERTCTRGQIVTFLYRAMA